MMRCSWRKDQKFVVAKKECAKDMKFEQDLREKMVS